MPAFDPGTQPNILELFTDYFDTTWYFSEHSSNPPHFSLADLVLVVLAKHPIHTWINSVLHPFLVSFTTPPALT